MDWSILRPIAPSGDRRGRRYYPVVATYILVGFNVLVFALMTSAGGAKNLDVLLEFGASFGPWFRAGQYWRLVMPMFLHIGLWHLLVNMFALYLLGSFLEPLYGYGRFTLLYVLSGMGGSLLSMEASPHIAAGASGAIFGIAGAMLVTGLLHPETVPRRWKDVFGIGILVVIVINLIFGHLVQHIDNWAHLGGLATGVIVALLIPPARLDVNSPHWSESAMQWIVILPLAIVLVAIGATANHYTHTQQVTRLLADSARLISAHQDSRARALLEEARRIDPDDARVHEALGLLDLGQKDYAAAIRDFQEALRLNPASVPDSLRLALAYEASGDLSKARQVLERAEQRLPPSPELQERLAEICANLGLYGAAIHHYNEALKLAPNSPVVLNNLAWLYATCSDPSWRNPRAALEHAIRAVQLTGWKQPSFIDTLAAALASSGQFKLAAETEARALRIDPGNQAFQESLAHYRKAAGL
ncbi:MAG: rhomboid family intramembrane serine protease [Terriglobia bacterium]